MKSLLICPSDRENISAFSENHPLAVLPVLGKTLMEYWLEHLATLGAKEVLILTSDQSEKILAHVGNGARWGLRVAVQHEIVEHSTTETRAKFQNTDTSKWLAAPNDALLMDHLPQQPEFPLFTSYANWFAALMNFLPRAATPERIGIRHLKSGVWMGLHSRVAPTAELHAPCWIGDNVRIGDGAIVGPNVVIEEKSFVESGAKICDSHIGAETFVGAFTNIEQSIALGNTLVNWKYNSVLKVPDDFLLCSCEKPRGAAARLLKMPTPAPLEQLEPEWSWKFDAKTEL